MPIRISWGNLSWLYVIVYLNTSDYKIPINSREFLDFKIEVEGKNFTYYGREDTMEGKTNILGLLQ